MKRFLLFIINIGAVFTQVLGQIHTQPQGAASVGIANASVTTANTWSVFNNQGTLSEVKNINAAFSFDLFHQIPGIKTLAFASTLPVSKNATAGLKILRSGNDIYNEQVVGLAFGHKIGNVSLGVSADYFQVNVTNYDIKSSMIVSFGGLVQLSKTLFLAAHIYNINLAKMNDYQNEKIPTVMKAGLSYRPFEKLMVNSEVVKDIYTSPDIRTGIEYKIVEKLPVRFGVNTLSRSFYTGFGFTTKDLSLDYALTSRQILGTSHTITLNYQLKNKKDKTVNEVEK